MVFTVYLPAAGGNCCVEDGKRIKRIHPIREIYIKSENEIKIYCWTGVVFEYPKENLRFFRDSSEAEAYVRGEIPWQSWKEEELGFRVKLPASGGEYCVKKSFGMASIYRVTAYWLISEHHIKIQCENESYLDYPSDQLTFFEDYESAKANC